MYETKGCSLLTSTYLGVKHKYEYICKCGNRHAKRLSNFEERPFCDKCVFVHAQEERRKYLRELNAGSTATFIIRPRNTSGDKDILVDKEDFEMLIRGGTWSVGKRGYAERHVPTTNTKEKMHRIILAARPGELVDHINHNKLDNRKSNLRLVSSSQNGANIKKSTPTKTGYKGVTLSEYGTYKVRIGVNNKRIYLGSFNSLDEAISAYNNAALEFHGDYAFLNSREVDE